MPALNFMARFADAVERGEKRQTIRAYRKDGRNPTPGDTLYLYIGQRTKKCRKLGEVECEIVEPIGLASPRCLRINGAWHGTNTYAGAIMLIDFAKADGFHSFDALLHCIEQMHGLPFEGLLIRW